MTPPESPAASDGLAVISPYDLSRLETLPEAAAADVETALATAYDAFRDRAGWPAEHRRIAILETAAGLMAARAEVLAETVVRESGKPIRDSRAEVDRAVDSLKAAVASLRSEAGRVVPMNLTPATDERMAFTRYEPVGVVVGIAAFQEPLNGVVQQVAPAVAAGCPVIVRPAPETPLSCLAFMEILREAGLPHEWGQAVVTSDDALCRRLATDPRVGLVAFAGDARTGWALRSRLAPGTRCTLRHGGAAPVVVAGDADVYEVREAILQGCYRHAGQSAVSVQRIFAHTRLATRFATQLAMKASGLLVGDPLHADTEVGPMIRPGEADRIHEWVEEAVAGGGQLLTGGERLTDTLYAPTVVFDPPPGCRLMTEEILGPVVCVDPWFRVDDALARANALPTTLQAAVFTRDIDRAMEIATGLDAAAVMINDPTAFRADWAPFEGLRQSGLGRGGIPDAIRGMRSEKMIVLPTRPLTAPPDAEPA